MVKYYFVYSIFQMFRDMEHTFITLHDITQYSTQLLEFGNIDEKTIMNIWIEPSEPLVADLSTIKYDYTIPLYQKMIFRFRNGSNSPAFLFNGVDPCNRHKLLCKFGMYDDLCYKIMDFFVWIKSMLSPYYIRQIMTPDEVERCLIQWNINEIKFFFCLLQASQEKLINKYNTECVATYDRLRNL